MIGGRRRDLLTADARDARRVRAHHGSAGDGDPGRNQPAGGIIKPSFNDIGNALNNA
jgi:hypothetical protein